MPYADREVQLKYWSDYQKKHRKEKSEYSISYYHRNKSEVIQKLGGICVCCSVIEDLTIDHIIPRPPPYKCNDHVYHEVRRFNYDKTKFQVLCRRCNRSKANTDKCRLAH